MSILFKYCDFMVKYSHPILIDLTKKKCVKISNLIKSSILQINLKSIYKCCRILSNLPVLRIEKVLAEQNQYFSPWHRFKENRATDKIF